MTTIQSKNCVAVLTRGYNNKESYENLIKRNQHIADNLNDKTTDILIFHEGNIQIPDQLFIKIHSPELELQFIDISNIAFNHDKQNVNVEELSYFGLGYRHMCSFWFINFFGAVKGYDKLLRIDEDCFINSNIDNIFLELNDYLFICGTKMDDEDYATVGLNNFSLDFIKKHENNFQFKNINEKTPYGPYTNLFGISLNQLNNNKDYIMFNNYKNDIENSDMIYKRRWGDLPLWGEVIYYIFGEETLKIDNTIKYFHGSHNTHVN